MWERGSSTHVDAPRPSITGAKLVVITRRCTRPFKDFFLLAMTIRRAMRMQISRQKPPRQSTYLREAQVCVVGTSTRDKRYKSLVCYHNSDCLVLLLLGSQVRSRAQRVTAKLQTSAGRMTS